MDAVVTMAQFTSNAEKWKLLLKHMQHENVLMKLRLTQMVCFCDSQSDLEALELYYEQFLSLDTIIAFLMEELNDCKNCLQQCSVKPACLNDFSEKVCSFHTNLDKAGVIYHELEDSFQLYTGRLMKDEGCIRD
jgi:hypothetical protein